jgi:hypothetical protein
MDKEVRRQVGANPCCGKRGIVKCFAQKLSRFDRFSVINLFDATNATAQTRGKASNITEDGSAISM